MIETVQTNWWVITGGPNSGKSWLLDELAFRGLRTMPEAARVHIHRHLSQGLTLSETRSDEIKFQHDVYKLKEQAERDQRINDLIFWERGKIGDTIAYMVANGIDWSNVYQLIEMRETHRYQGVFLLDPLPYSQDYARTETEEQAHYIHQLLDAAYTLQGYPIIRVPVSPVEQRADFVLSHINRRRISSKKRASK